MGGGGTVLEGPPTCTDKPELETDSDSESFTETLELVKEKVSKMRESEKLESPRPKSCKWKRKVCRGRVTTTVSLPLTVDPRVRLADHRARKRSGYRARNRHARRHALKLLKLWSTRNRVG